MTVEENKGVIRRWIEEGWNQGNLHVADEIYAPDFVAQDIDRVMHGPEDVKQMVILVRAAFPDIHFTVDHLIGEGDKVVGAFTIRGTHKGEFVGIPATGKQVAFTAVDIWRFEAGKIVERHVASFDRLDVLQQLGVISKEG